MGWFDLITQRLAKGLSLLLEPVDATLQRLGLGLRIQMEGMGVPASWQGGIIVGLWLLLLLTLLRGLWGGWRLLAAALVAAVLAKVYGGLPDV